RYLALRPGQAAVHHDLGVAYAELGQYDQAIHHYQATLDLQPDHAKAHYNLGNVHRFRNQAQPAIECYRRALAIDSGYADAIHNLGVCFQMQSQFEEAMAHYRHALTLKPDSAEIYNSIGSLLRLLGKLEESVAQIQQAIALKPNYVEAHTHLGLARYHQGQFDAAHAAYAQALRLAPHYPSARFNRSLLLLLLGDFVQGFAEYEWRWRRQDYRPRSFTPPVWAGEDLSGKTILVYAEQGFGDTVQFVRYLPLVAQRGGRIVLECQKELVTLLQALPDVEQVIAKGEPLPPFDCHVALLSLPHVLGTTLEDVPAPVPYLFPPVPSPPLSLPATPTKPLRVGLVWAGNPLNPNDGDRSTQLQTLLPLLAVPGITFYSLQKGEKAEELRQLQAQQQALNVVDLDPQLQSFADTAAAIAQLDLVITVDTAVAHVAGALGKPVWVLLCFVPDWRWLWQRDDSPWYPTARLFRQPRPGDWGSVCQQVAAALTLVVEHPPDSDPATEPETAIALARQHFAAKRYDDAAQICRRVLLTTPKAADALYLLGLVANRQQQLSTAIAFYQRTLALLPDPQVYNDLGNALQRQNRYDEAIPCYQQAIARKPDYAAAYSNMGAAYQELKQFEPSIAAYHQALALRPHYADAHYNLGNTYRSQGDFEQAIACYQQAIALNPRYLAAFNNAGLCYHDLADPDTAIAQYRAALAMDANYADAHLNLGLSLLLLGNLVEGFAEYEWRWRVNAPDFRPPPPFSQPRWQGDDLSGQTILLQAEQGLGDTLQFVRYVPLVAKQCDRLILEVQPPLAPLLANLPGVDQLIIQGQPLPEFDTYAPLLSLPHILGMLTDQSATAIPAAVPYLVLDPSAAVALPVPDALAATPHLKVGIVWAGNPTHRGDRYRSATVEDFEPLLALEAIAFYSLQVGTRADDILPYRDRYAIHDLSPSLKDFADTAAAIQQLDLVITVDTSVAHLAGALGKPVWVLLTHAPDWRWMLHREDSPWYPTARLFRQTQRGDWSTVIERVKAALSILSSSSLPSPTLPLPPSLSPSSPTLPSSLPPSPSHPSSLSPSPPRRSPPAAPIPIGIGFPIGVDTGWRVYGLNLALNLAKHPDYEPVPLIPLCSPHLFNPLHRATLTPTLTHQQRLHDLLKANPDHSVTGSFLMLTPLGNNMVTPPETRRILGKRNVGVIFFEDTHLIPDAIAYARQFDRIVAGSHWNAEVLASYGIESVVTVQQGIEPTIFHPAPKSNLLGDRFVIFSGGKLEYRKGQDLAIAAFRAFHQRHPDALLMTAWHNPWVETMTDLDRAGHVVGLPQVNAQKRLQVTDWLVANGIPADAVIDIGLIPNFMAGQIVREADVALFPNRAEGGTNLVAMECLACGIPTILSANTGHRDLISDSHCYPLRHQGPVRPTEQYCGTEGWGESDLDEIVAALEQVYSQRQQAQQRGAAAAQFMQGWTWSHQVQRLLTALEDLL
ncbi:MAG TPA: tetratricopeptide repeat protein, partial [Chroococcidiopsis sp.]